MSERNKAIFSLIFKLLTVDKKFHLRERKYLHDLADSLGLSSQETKDIILGNGEFTMTPPPSEQERMMILYYILFAIRIDGKILPEEENAVYAIGTQLGFRDNMLSDMITVMKNHLDKRLAPDILVSVIRKYMN